MNADACPIHWLPVSAISWQNAVRLIWLEIVEVLHTYDDWLVHSPSIAIPVPAVVMLRKPVKGFRKWLAQNHSPRASLVFLRDLYVCQYCLRQFHPKQLTIDHVVPRVYGGRTNWSNVTTSCDKCNNRRGCNQSIRPAVKPFLPTVGQLIKNMRRFAICMPHQSWNLYLHWPADLVHIDPRKNITYSDYNFDAMGNFQLDSIAL